MKANSRTEIEKPLALEFFSAGVPAGLVFETSLDDLDHVISLAQLTGVERIAALCFIGLVSYFEAFCKDHAAAIINIAPSLIGNLRQAGQNTHVDAGRALEFGSGFQNKIGCLIMENYDFGTAKRINAIYNALLKITPFSKNETKKYDKILRDRNLLVHHGGTYTSKYIEQLGGRRARITDAYWNSLIVKQETLNEAIDFLENIAKKISQTSYTALDIYLKKSHISIEPERAKALDFLLWKDRNTI